MPTPTWRYEKAASTVTAICQVLRTDLEEEQRSRLSIALHDALKLVCDAMGEGDPAKASRWTPGVVKVFFEQPEQCERWLELLDEPEFNPDYYG